MAHKHLVEWYKNIYAHKWILRIQIYQPVKLPFKSVFINTLIQGSEKANLSLLWSFFSAHYVYYIGQKFGRRKV